MAVVVTDRVGGAQIGYPAGFEQRNQPGVMLSRYRNRTGNRQRQRASHTDRAIENLINAAQVRAAERRQAVSKKFIECGASVDAADVYVSAVIGGHKLTC